MADETCSEGTWMRSLDNNVAKNMNKLGKSDRDEWRHALKDEYAGSKILELLFRTESSDQISGKSFPRHSYVVKSWMQDKILEYLSEDSTSEFPQRPATFRDAENGPIRITIELPPQIGHEMRFATLEELEQGKETIVDFVRSQIQAQNNSGSEDSQLEDEPPETPSAQLEKEAPDTPSEQVDNIDTADNPAEIPEVVDLSKKLETQALMPEDQPSEQESTPFIEQIINRVEQRIGHTQITADDLAFVRKCLMNFDIGQTDLSSSEFVLNSPQIKLFETRKEALDASKFGPKSTGFHTFSSHLEACNRMIELDERNYRTWQVRSWMRHLTLFCMDAIRKSTDRSGKPNPMERAAILIMTIVSSVERKDEKTGKERSSYILVVLSGMT